MINNHISGKMNDFSSSFAALACERLTQKQKFILRYLLTFDNKTNVTKLVPKLSRELSCSKSSVWNNLRGLKRSNLIIHGNLEEKGTPIKLTLSGEYIAKNLEVIK